MKDIAKTWLVQCKEASNTLVDLLGKGNPELLALKADPEVILDDTLLKLIEKLPEVEFEKLLDRRPFRLVLSYVIFNVVQTLAECFESVSTHDIVMRRLDSILDLVRVFNTKYKPEAGIVQDIEQLIIYGKEEILLAERPKRRKEKIFNCPFSDVEVIISDLAELKVLFVRFL